MFVRGYLRASTKSQDALRAKKQLENFASERNLRIAAFYVENESGASLNRPQLFDLIKEAHVGDMLLVENVDRLSRLSEPDWNVLKESLRRKEIKIVALDLPTSWLMATTDDFTTRMFSAMNEMMLDMLAAIARKDYVTRRERAAQGIKTAQQSGKYKGRRENLTRNNLIRKHLISGQSSWQEIMDLTNCSRGTVARQAALLKLQS